MEKEAKWFKIKMVKVGKDVFANLEKLAKYFDTFWIIYEENQEFIIELKLYLNIK